MAKVEVAKNENKVPVWEPFLTVTLSKREAIGLLALTYVIPDGLIHGYLYSLIEKEVRHIVNSDGLDRMVGKLRVDGCVEAMNNLDYEFGKV